jgi:hypothetical protein
MLLFIVVPVAIILYVGGLVAFIIWIVGIASEDARQQFDSFLNAAKQRDSITAYNLLTSELQSAFSWAHFEYLFLNRIAPQLSNYIGLSYNGVKMRGSQALLRGKLKGSGQPFSVQLIKSNKTWKIAAFTIGDYIVNTNLQGTRLDAANPTVKLKDTPDNPPPLLTTAPPKKMSNSKAIKLFIVVPLIVIVYVTGLLTFILWIVGLASEDAYREFDNFVNATKQRDTVAAYALLTPELQSTYTIATFETEFVNQIAPELSNYAGLNANSTSVRNSVARLSGTFKGSGQAYSVRLINRDNKWKIVGFSIGRFRAGSI